MMPCTEHASRTRRGAGISCVLAHSPNSPARQIVPFHFRRGEGRGVLNNLPRVRAGEQPRGVQPSVLSTRSSRSQRCIFRVCSSRTHVTRSYASILSSVRGSCSLAGKHRRQIGLKKFHFHFSVRRPYYNQAEL